MAKINLLPWRAERRKERQREFGVMIAFAALVGGLIWGAVHLYYSGLIEHYQERQRTINEEIADVDRKIAEIEKLEETRARLLNRKEVIERLQANRSQMVHLFDELVKATPDGVQLTGIKQAGTELTLDGISQSQARVSTYMRSLDRSDWLSGTQLAVIQSRDAPATAATRRSLASSRFTFTLKVTLKSPTPPSEDGTETLDDDGAEVAQQ